MTTTPVQMTTHHSVSQERETANTAKKLELETRFTQVKNEAESLMTRVKLLEYSMEPAEETEEFDISLLSTFESVETTGNIDVITSVRKVNQVVNSNSNREPPAKRHKGPSKSENGEN